MKRFRRTAELVREAVENGIFPSAALAVGVGGETCLFDVWGNGCIVSEVVPADTDTLYDLASLSRVLATAMVAFRLIEEGRLRLNDTVGMFFKSNPVKAAITVEQLLTHTSGFAPHLLLEQAARGPLDAVRVILKTPLICAPGEAVNDSSVGFILLGRMLEEAGGAPLDILAQKYVFTPLEMFSTTYAPRGANIACTEVVNGSPLKGVVHDDNARFMRGVAGNAGVFSTLGDCAKLASMLATGGHGFLSGAMLRLATEDHTAFAQEHRGLGFLLASTKESFCGDLFPSHAFGETGETGTSLLVEPETGLWVVLLTNSIHPSRENAGIFRFRGLLHNTAIAEFTR